MIETKPAPSSTGNRTTFRRIAAAAIGLALLTSCSGGSDSSGSAEYDFGSPDADGGGEATEGFAPSDDGADLEEAGPVADEAERSAGAAETSGDANQSPVAPISTEDIGRSIVYTATLNLTSDDVPTATRQAQQVIATLGGLVFGQTSTSEPVASTTLVFRLPPADFQTALDRLAELGELENQQVTADDVTERVVDLQSRIRTAEVSVERLRRLLEDASTLEAIASLETQLMERETNLELLRGQLRTVEGQVSLATIYLTISEETPPEPDPRLTVEVTGYQGDDEGNRCPGERRLRIDEGDDLILCVEITNTGNTAVRDIEVRDPGLDLTKDDFTLIDFDDEDVLEPEEAVIAWAALEVELDSRPWPNVTAMAVDENGDEIRIGITMEEVPIELDVIEDTSLPGLTDSIASGWSVVVRLFGYALVLLGALIPFTLVAIPLAALWIWWRRRHPRPEVQAPTPPPPPPGAS